MIINNWKSWSFWTILELVGLFMILRVAIPFAVNIKGNISGWDPFPNALKVIIFGFVLFFYSIYKKWKLPINLHYKSKFLRRSFEFVGITSLIIMGALFTNVYFISWVANWEEKITLILGPLVLIAIFLFYKDLEKISLFFESSKEKEDFVTKKDNLSINFLSTEDTIFNILEELCGVRNDQLYTKKSLLEKLNEGEKIDSPYYGFSGEEFKMLVDQGYIYYWTPNMDKKELKNSEKAIMATPKAFELVEAKKNRLTSIENTNITGYIALIALFIAFVNLIKPLFNNSVPISIFWGLILTSIVGINIIRLSNSRKNK